MVAPDYSLWGLFISSLLSSTLLPGGSEIVLIYLYQQNDNPYLLLGIASLGNSLGGISSYAIGRLLVWRFPQPNFEQHNRRALERLQRWGSPALLFSWLPIVGDPLCLAAGWLRTNVASALLYISCGKAARYAIILFLTPIQP